MKKADDRFKKKGMYLVTTFGAVFVLALAAAVSGLLSDGKKKTPGKIDLNATPAPQIGSNNIPTPTNAIERQATPVPTTKPPVNTPEQVTQNDPNPVNQNDPEITKPEETISVGDVSEAEPQVPEVVDDPVEPAVNPEGVIGALHFSRETGMLPPVTGEALISFSMDHAVYYETLDSYRTTNFVLLAAEKGTHICAGSDGVVKSISFNEKTGNTLTLTVSDSTNLVYGLLDNISVEEGQFVDAGTVFASVGEPTRYFVEEGSGVYLQVLENNEAVNPMMFLK